MIAAPRERLLEIQGVGESVATHSRSWKPPPSGWQAKMMGRPALSSWAALLDYCTAAMAREKEEFRVLFLDRKNHLIADEVQNRGTVDHTPVYPREIIKRALELGASSIILVHNHPSGDPTPSKADIAMTREIAGVAEAGHRPARPSGDRPRRPRQLQVVWAFFRPAGMSGSSRPRRGWRGGCPLPA